jgi:hypothetical protein
MALRRIFCAVLAVLLTCGELSARGMGQPAEDPHNPEHINGLPTEIRSAIMNRCTTPKALHTFASYFDHSKRIVLHFEDLSCDQTGAFCNASGCLHQVWVSEGGHYKLQRSFYGPTGD